MNKLVDYPVASANIEPVQEFTAWPIQDQKRYRQAGIWQGISLPQYLKKSADKQPEKLALVDSDKSLSYRELIEQVDTLAIGFYQLGLRTGDRAVLHLPNIVEFHLSFFALLRLGVQPILALPAHRESELSYFCQFSEAKVVISANQGGFNVTSMVKELAQRKALPTFVVEVSEVSTEPGIVSWSSILSAGQQAQEQVLPSEQKLIAMDFAFFQLSGGTTGTPKLIPRTHDDYLYSILASNEVCQFDEATRYLCILPCAHNFPLSSPGVLGVLFAGGTAFLCPDPSVSTVFSNIQRHRINVTALVPPLVVTWLQRIEQEPTEALQSLKLLQVGGARLSVELAKRVTPELGCQLQQIFGMAEGLVNYTRLDDPLDEIIQTQGRPMSQFDEIRIVDEQGHDVEQGEEGALLVKGPYTIRGYFKAPVINQRSFTDDGYYITGDRVRLTSAGNVQVVGREKDQINRGGEKIAAEEIENLLLSHPDIKNAALIAIPDEVFGEKSCAVLLLDEQISLKPFEIKRFLRKTQLADYKIPDRIEFVSSLPTTPVGKIDKKALQKVYQ